MRTLPSSPFQASAWGGAQCADWAPRGGGAGIGLGGRRLRGGSGRCAPTRMRKAWFSGTDADACRWGRLPRRGVVVIFAVCKLRRLEGRGTTVVPRKGLRTLSGVWGQENGRARAG